MAGSRRFYRPSEIEQRIEYRIPISPSLPYHLHQIVYLHPFANSHVSPSAASLVRTINISAFAGLRPSSFESYISFIPSRLGYNIALDDAVDCLTELYSTMLVLGHSQRSCHRSKNICALSSLRKCLEDDVTALGSETLCATLLLGTYEVLANPGPSAMLQHMRGAGDLIRLRGAARHVEPFERAMLLVAQGPLSTVSIATGLRSSLDSQKWRMVIAEAPPNSILEEDRPCQKLKFLDGISIPQLVQNFLAIMHFEKPDTTKVTELLDQAMRFRRRFLRWAENLADNQGEAADQVTKSRDTSTGIRLLPATRLLEIALSSSIASCQVLDIGAYGNYYGWIIIINRIILCLTKCRASSAPPTSSGQVIDQFASVGNLEEENRQLADMAFETERFLRTSRPLALIYYKFSLHVAKATKITTNSWSAQVRLPYWTNDPRYFEHNREQAQLMSDFLGLIRQFGSE